MLPDFPTLKNRLMDRHTREFRARVDEQTPIVSKIRSVRLHEGDRFSVERDDGVIESQDFVDVRIPLEISAQLEYSETIKTLKERNEQLTMDVASQLEKHFFERFREITEEVGNAIDAKGAPFTLEFYLDSLERLEIDFDMFGLPIYPLQICHPSMASTIRAELGRLKSESLLRERAELIIEKKRKDWRDRESRRRLVT
jgi:hypothetical protein